MKNSENKKVKEKLKEISREKAKLLKSIHEDLDSLERMFAKL
jgi:Holliday junction resolvasome RuvABC endonuclease subunit|tara:strand:+ start:1874 stop:1999 length:126 start_codon:yes stop_codon:yes gene_type:complete